MSKWQKIFAFIVFLIVCIFGYQVGLSYQHSLNLAEKKASPQGQLPDNISPLSYDLTLRVDPQQSHFSGVVKINLSIKKPIKEIWLHGKDIEPKVVKLNTEQGPVTLSYKEMGHSGVVRLRAQDTIAAQQAQLEIHYSAPFDTQLAGLYKVQENGLSYIFSQFEATDARKAFPSFDEPRFKVPFDLALEIKPQLKGFANTPQLKQQLLPDGFKRLTFATTKALPTYLLAFAVGDFDVVEPQPIEANEVRHHPLPLRGITVKGKGEQMKFALENTAAILSYLENYFAIPYPFEKLDLVAVPDFSSGAMENPGLIAYREQFLLLGDTPSYQRRRAFAKIHAHELAHQWFGNLVTMPWWNDLWLNEAFATWMANQAVDAWDSTYEFDRDLIRSGHNVMKKDALLSARQVREPIENNDVIANAFDDITYQKGGAVLQMLESFIGREIFRQGVQYHLQRFAYGHADAFDFIDSMAKVSNMVGLKSAFASFLTQAGVPVVNLQWQCSGGKVEIVVKQQKYLVLGSEHTGKELWHLPLCMTLVNPAIGQASSTSAICRMIDQQEQVIEFAGQCPQTIMPNHQGRGYYRFSYDKVQWQYLMKNLNKLDSAEQFSVADNLGAAFRAGEIDVNDYLSAFAPLTQSTQWDVIISPIAELQFIAEYIAEGSEKKPLADYLESLYGPLVDRLGLQADTELDQQNPVATALLRRSLVNFMALDIKEAKIRAQLLNKAKAYIGFQTDQKLAPSMLGEALVTTALSVAVDELGQPFFAALKSMIEDSDDAAFRQNGMRALGATVDPKLAEEVRSMALSLSIKNNERAYLISAQMAQKENRHGVYNWMKDYFSVVATILPESILTYTPVVGRGFCTMEDAEDIEQFFSRKLVDIAGAEQNLKLTLDRIRACVALKARQTGIVFSE